jgi:hypothetical protein
VTAPGGYARTTAITLSPRVVPWVAPACLVVAFVLTFFPWVGYFPGGYGVVTQSGWGAAFGMEPTVDRVFNKNVEWTTRTPPEFKPGAGPFLILSLLLLVPAVVAAAAAVALPRLHGRVNLPPQLATLEPWRWLLTTALTLLVLFFLTLQLSVGFSLDNRTRDRIEKKHEEARKAAKTDDEEKWVDIQIGMKYAELAVRRTWNLRLTFLLLVLAALGAAAANWLEQRGPGRPPPRFEILW